ncbi:uncharacterized protein DS421_19g643240 [Arachis hypogaea]|uniref:Transposase (putative) gypsy type domain-containing protein n=1 Tax=Arachis hypogaea TaxID=3818 RepID=A0A6B9V5S1_ARAHY|nr:uncharacterized protein DS421_19g643240 [Arachis hypogaea]
MAGEKLKEKLKAVEVREDDPYHWVQDDVKTRSSSFISIESLSDLRGIDFVRGGSGVVVEFQPCSSSDRACERRGDWEYFYMYTPCMVELGVKFPFSSFECDVLTQLNCAPSQLHPNSWAFLCAFQCLMEFLSFPCSLSLFFSLFQAKGVRKGLWVCFSSFPGRSVFLLYKSSFKNFKSLFVKVRSAESEYPFYLDDELSEKFPLYWCSEPTQILEASERSEEEEFVMNFLVESVAAGECLSIPDILRLYDSGDNEGLRAYIGGRVPLLDPNKLQSFLNKKKEKGVGSTGDRKDVGEQAFSFVAHPASSFKRKRDDTSLEVISEGDHEVVGGSGLAFDRQKKLHGFIAGSSSHSLWSEQFNFVGLSERASQYPGDMLMTRRAGMEVLGKFVQVVASRLLCIGRTVECVGAEHQEAVDKASTLEKSYTAWIADLEKVVKEKDEVATSAVAKAKEAEDEVVRLRDQIRLLQTEVKEHDVAKGRLTSRVHELEEAGMEMFSYGFDRAVSQVALLAPEFDCDKLDMTKIVVGGKLVVDGTAEEHDENAPS